MIAPFKHKNLALSTALLLLTSTTGSADILDELGSAPSVTTEESGQTYRDIDIQSDIADYDMKANIAVFKKNVRVVDGKTTITADRMTVHLIKNDTGKNSPEKITATKNVVIIDKESNQEARAQQAVYHAADQRVVLTKNPVIIIGDGERVLKEAETVIYNKQSGSFRTEGGRPVLLLKTQPGEGGLLPSLDPLEETAETKETEPRLVEISSNKVEMTSNKQLVVFIGDVHVIDGDMTIDSQKMDVYLQDNEIKKVVAIDDVIIDQPGKQHSTAGKAIYTPAEEILELTQDPVVKIDGTTLTGEKSIIYDKKTGKISNVGGGARLKGKIKDKESPVK